MSFFQNKRVGGNRLYGRINMYWNQDPLTWLNPWDNGFSIRVVHERHKSSSNTVCHILDDCNIRLVNLFRETNMHNLQGLYVTFVEEVTFDNQILLKDITVASLSDLKSIRFVEVESYEDFCIPGISGYIECPTCTTTCKKSCLLIHTDIHKRFHEKETSALEAISLSLHQNLCHGSWMDNGLRVPFKWEVFSRGVSEYNLNKMNIYLPEDIQQTIFDLLVRDEHFGPNYDLFSGKSASLFKGNIKGSCINIYICTNSKIYLKLSNRLYILLKMMPNKALVNILSTIQNASTYVYKREKIPKDIETKIQKYGCEKYIQKEGRMYWTFNSDIRITSNPSESNKNILRLSNGLSMYNPPHCGRVMGSFCDFTHLHVLDESKELIIGVSNKYFDGQNMQNICNMIIFDTRGKINIVRQLVDPNATSLIYCYDFAISPKYNLIYLAMNQGTIYILKITDVLADKCLKILLEKHLDIVISSYIIGIIQFNIYLFICDQHHLYYICLSDDGIICRNCPKCNRYIYENIPIDINHQHAFNISMCIINKNQHNSKLAILRSNNIYIYNLYSLTSSYIPVIIENNITCNSHTCKLKLCCQHNCTLFTNENVMAYQTLIYDGSKNFIIHTFDSTLLVSIDGTNKTLHKNKDLPILNSINNYTSLNIYRGIVVNNKYMIMVNNNNVNISQLLCY